jgi:hypothetical protein
MSYRFSIFLAMVASVIAMMLFYPPHALGLMSKETLMSFNNGGMDLLPDVRVINTEGSVTYTITIKVLRVIEWVNLYLLEHTSKNFQTKIFLVS